MNDDKKLAPDSVASLDPFGDRTARRFVYQWTYAAVLCCLLLDETEDTTDVLCEQHEDILLKHADGTFSGLQIKTRDESQNVWKTKDNGVKKTCVRFAQLHAEFPEHFRKFQFLTNHPLYAAKNSQSLPFILECIRDAAALEALPRPVTRYIAQVARLAGCPEDTVLTALSKTEADDSLPKLSDVESRLIATLTDLWDRARECSFATVDRAAKKLLHECSHASSLGHLGVLPAFLPASKAPAEKELLERLAAKRIDRSRIRDILDVAADSIASLEDSPELLVRPGDGSTALLQSKLDAGGFSAVSINSAKDLRNKADYLGVAWTKKHGYVEGLQRYGHVRSLVLADAASAFESTQDPLAPFGLKMLRELRSRLVKRKNRGERLYECSGEHLEGFAYSLTSLCAVRWSVDTPWEEE